MINSSAFFQVLLSLGDKPIYFDHLGGNNGDRLILEGMQHLLKKSNAVITSELETASVVLLNGGGGMNDSWPLNAIQRLQWYIENYPGKAIIVGPSSFSFKHTSFKQIVESSSAPITICCREEISEKLLRSLNLKDNIEIMLSRDLALELEDSLFLSELRQKSSSDIVLVAIRADIEGQSTLLARVKAPWMPQLLRRPLSKLRDRLAAVVSKGRVEQALVKAGIDIRKDAIFYRDISSALSFEGFCDTVCRSRYIVTDRLHVGLLGALMGKKVTLLRGGYHKIEGVYNYSLVGRDSVTLL